MPGMVRPGADHQGDRRPALPLGGDGHIHLENAARKLGARNRAQAVARAAHYHFLEGVH